MTISSDLITNPYFGIVLIFLLFSEFTFASMELRNARSLLYDSHRFIFTSDVFRHYLKSNFIGYNVIQSKVENGSKKFLYFSISLFGLFSMQFYITFNIMGNIGRSLAIRYVVQSTKKCLGDQNVTLAEVFQHFGSRVHCGKSAIGRAMNPTSEISNCSRPAPRIFSFIAI